MNLKSLNDEILISKTEHLVHQERELLTDVLHHLHEIERRRLFSALGYKSTFDFAVRRLGYAEDQAYRRITAMRLMFEIPELEEKITAGEISLSHIGLAQSLFRQEKKLQQAEVPRAVKLELLERISNKSVREAERIVLSMSSAPELTRPDRVHPVSDSKVELKFVATNDLIEKIETLKGRLAHQFPTISLGELFETLCDLGLERWNPARFATSRKRCVTELPDQIPQDRQTENDSGAAPHSSGETHWRRGDNAESRVLVAKPAPYISAKNRREVFSRASNRCENCRSSYALEIDHIQPQAMGGSSTIENLRVLCRSCNQRAAVQAFGLRKMNDYLNR